MRTLPALDLHAHVDATIAPEDLTALNAAIFAVTRSLDEADVALRRSDQLTVWGVGCHPGLVGAHREFSIERFAGLLDDTPFVGEIGLDGKSRVPMSTQAATLRSVFDTLRAKPRIASVHSYAATGQLLELLSENRPTSIVLHWWLGSEAETAAAVELGCHFSVNAAMLKRDDILRWLPLDRVLTETDHPFGDRRSRSAGRPGAVIDVERALATIHELTPEAIRFQLWRNLRVLVSRAQVGAMLPRAIRQHLAAV